MRNLFAIFVEGEGGASTKVRWFLLWQYLAFSSPNIVGNAVLATLSMVAEAHGASVDSLNVIRDEVGSSGVIMFGKNRRR